VPRPDRDPLGLHLTRVAKLVSRAFDDALASVGGSLPQWLVLVELKGRTHGNQRTIAEAVGVEGPTLTHHLNRMEAGGLVTRRRDPENRRIHQVELTPAGDAMFLTLLEKVVEFDERLRHDFSERDLAQLDRLLDRLAANAAAGSAATND
jgi:MarR family transcriptional regulator for hemolysin